jgi:hypothetical protein
LISQASTNRSAPTSNRPAANHHPLNVNIGSPLLTNKTDHSSPTIKNAPGLYSSPPANFHAPPTPTQRTLPKIPTSSNNNSPSLSIRSSTNANISPEIQHPSMVINTDSASIKSDDSSTFSEGHLHPSQQQQQQQQSSTRNQETKQRSQQQNNLGKSLINTVSSSTGTTNSSMGIPIDRAPSPSPSLISEREREEHERVERELELKRKRLQIYVFICRCIACPFNSKQSSDMARKHLKITPVQYGVTKERFLAFLNGKTHIEADEGNKKEKSYFFLFRSLAFINAVRSYYEIFLKSERVNKMVQSGGCCSDDFRDVFRINIEKRVRSLPDIDSLKISKDTVLTLWMSKFDAIYRGQDQDQDTSNRRLSKSNYMSTSAELIMSKEQLYDMFQNVLIIKKFEHQ